MLIREQIIHQVIFLRKSTDEMGNIVHYYSHGGKFEFHQPNE